LPALRTLDPGTALWDRIVAVLPDRGGAARGHGQHRSPRGPAFAGRRPVSVAVPSYACAEHENIGVITDRTFRGRGLATACAAAKDLLRAPRRRPPRFFTKSRLHDSSRSV